MTVYTSYIKTWSLSPQNQSLFALLPSRPSVNLCVDSFQMTTSTTIYIVAGIVSGVVALNLTLLFGWIFLKPRGKSSIVADASSKHSLTSNITALPQPPLASLPTRPAPSAPIDYRQLIVSVNDNQLPRSSSHKSFHESDLTPAPQRSIRSFERRKTKPPGLQSSTSSLTVQRARSQRSYRSYWSQRSTDSESLYSVASAPMDMHERSVKPMTATLETIIASPSVGNFPDEVQTIVEEHDSIETGTDPSLYPSTPHNPRFVLTPPSPIAALNIRKNNHIPSSSFSSSSDVPFSSFPDSFSPSNLPRIPPRSPLRHH